ncbi:MAG TPA: pyruvate kinase [Phycisphaerales bacterium]|nr:pyruvate kinase [Phycisphaerales bacterium]
MTIAAACQPPETDRRLPLARIVATIGPASESPQMVRSLIEAGVSVFRFNFSHGSLEDHARRLAVVREVSAELERPIAALGDLQGPKIRVGKVPDGGIMLESGQDVIFRRGVTMAFTATPIAPGEPPRVVFGTTYEPLIDEAVAGHRVLINDGLVRLLAIERSADGHELLCRVTVGGLVTSSKGINLPESELSAPAISDRDWACVNWAVENALDFLALSFVRKPDEINELRSYLEQAHPTDRRADMQNETATIPIIAKIEMPQALKNLEAIIDASDGVMVARGDLGVEMDIACVPIAQKAIVSACNKAGKPCIVATQMLESMITNSTPTRAESTDIANAIFDGADALMLSGETATGQHPLLVVETMTRIARAAEDHMATLPTDESAPTRLFESHVPIAALCRGAWRIASDIKARAVVCWSERTGTARYLSQNAFNVPIVAYSSSIRATRRMALLRGIHPVCARPPATGTLGEWNEQVDTYLLAHKLVKEGDPIVLVAGKPLGQARVTNSIAMHRVGQTQTGYRAVR